MGEDEALMSPDDRRRLLFRIMTLKFCRGLARGTVWGCVGRMDFNCRRLSVIHVRSPARLRDGRRRTEPAISEGENSAKCGEYAYVLRLFCRMQNRRVPPRYPISFSCLLCNMRVQVDRHVYSRKNATRMTTLFSKKLALLKNA